jgi:hypothetical protein
MVFTDSTPYASERLEEAIAKFVERLQGIAPEPLEDWGHSRIEKEARYRMICYACETGSPYSRSEIIECLEYLHHSSACFPEVPTKAVLRLYCLAKLVWWDCQSSQELLPTTSEFIDREQWSHAEPVPADGQRRSDSAERNKTNIMTAFKHYQQTYGTCLIPFQLLESLELMNDRARSAIGYPELDIMNDVMTDVAKKDIIDTKLNLKGSDHRVEMMRAFDADWLAAQEV